MSTLYLSLFGMASGYVLIYTVAFMLYGLMEVLGLMPQEIKSAGVTLTGVFGSFYGDLNTDFITYQVKRTAITTLAHSSLPSLYCIGLSFLDQHLSMWIVLLWVFSLITFLLGLTVVLYWFHQDWQNHPLKVQLAKTGQPWRSVASSINLEFRDVNKFISELGGSTVVVTDSWIIQCNLRSVDIIHQRDAVLNVASSDEHQFSLDNASKQFITINVNSINTQFKSFDIRLNSYQYSQLRDRLLSPVRIARNVVIHQSLTDRFAAAFAEQVERNGIYTLPQDSTPLEPCIGCLQTLPGVKLQKLCSDNTDTGPCRQCFCKPLWCMPCLSKWFASRQDKHRPEGWMASHASCPMCRATFCMLDVQKITVD